LSERQHRRKGDEEMKCPICDSTTSIEIDMHSDGYAKDLIECANCEAIWLSNSDEIVLLNK
jgi:transcription elongation factor Elf1